MRSRQRGSLAVLAAIVCAAPAAVARTAGEAAEEAAAFSAEVTVTRAIVTEAGRLVREAPASRYRLERLADGRVRLTMRATRPQPAVGPMADPYAGIVVEQDEGGALRLLRADGTPLPGAPPAVTGLVPPQVLSTDGWIARLGDAAVRRQTLAATFGPRVGTVQGLDRHVIRNGGELREVLVSPRLALPLEVNVMSGRALEERHQFEYDERPDGHVVRTRTRSESRVPDTSGHRLVSITVLAAVEIAGGAR
jgi:hypothetical protein